MIDGDSLKSQPELSFLRKAENPVVWIFTRHSDIRQWSEAKSRFELVRQTLPVYETNLGMFFCYAAMRELHENPRYRHVIIIAGNNQYSGLVEFLKEKGFSAESRMGDRPERRESRSDNRQSARENAGPVRSREERPDRRESDRRERSDRPERRERSENPPRNDAQRADKQRDRAERPTSKVSPERTTSERPNTPRNASPERQQPASSKPAQAEPRASQDSPKPEILAKIAASFNEQYQPGNTYQKSFLGMLVNQATGKNAAEVLGTKSTKPLIKAMLVSGCIESIDEQRFQVLKAVSVEDLKLPPLENAPVKKQRPPKPKNHSEASSDAVLEPAS